MDSITIATCDLCSLKGSDYAFSRIHRGIGAKVMFIGEAPGEEEAKQHLAFVGRSGKLLDRWIDYMLLTNYVITNVVRHRPPDNRKPTDDEVKACAPYLLEEIEREEPDYIIGLGSTSISHSFNSMHLNVKDAINAYLIHPSYMFADGTCRIFAFYHPSYVLRSHINVFPLLDLIMEAMLGR